MSHPQSDAIKEIVWVGGKTTQSHMLSVHPCSVQPRHRQPESHDILFIPFLLFFIHFPLCHQISCLLWCTRSRPSTFAVGPSIQAGLGVGRQSHKRGGGHSSLRSSSARLHIKQIGLCWWTDCFGFCVFSDQIAIKASSRSPSLQGKYLLFICVFFPSANLIERGESRPACKTIKLTRWTRGPQKGGDDVFYRSNKHDIKRLQKGE